MTNTTSMKAVITFPKRFPIQAMTAEPASPPRPPPNAMPEPKTDDTYARSNEKMNAPLNVTKVVFSNPMLLCQKNSL